jgi:Ni/Fe-hydrogenase subunit HybB-like protein
MTGAAAARRLAGRIGFWETVFAIVLVLFSAVTVLRFTRGLGAVTNLSDRFPWGLWVGFDVLCGVGLAAGAFTLTAIVHVFNLHRFEPIVRPTVLTALLGYLLVIAGLFFDLGQPWRIWHALVFWNPHSVMFEVAWCVMLYTTVLALEFAPVVLERLRLERPRRMLRTVATPLVIAGVILSTLHQSSLGSLYLIVPAKLHPLWYTPLLPYLFLISAVGAGIGMTILESYLSERAFGRRLEMDLLEPLGRGMVVALGVYGLVRVIVIVQNGAAAGLLHPGYEGTMFLLEMLVGVVLPVGLLLIERIRTNPTGLVVAALFSVVGFVVNRLNVSVTGMEAAAGVRYVPSWMEISVSLGLVALGFASFALAVRHLPVFPEPARRRAS